jgi:hypothetical protein
VINIQSSAVDIHLAVRRSQLTGCSGENPHGLRSVQARQTEPGQLDLGQLTWLKIGQLAYSQVSSIPAKLNEDKHEDLTQVRLYIVQIQLALGKFCSH